MRSAEQGGYPVTKVSYEWRLPGGRKMITTKKQECGDNRIHDSLTHEAKRYREDEAAVSMWGQLPEDSVH